MGAVYAAFDERLERRIALKVVSAKLDPSATSRLLREARAAAALSHPSAIVVHDVHEHDGTLYIAMELLEGDTLLRATAGASWQVKLRHLLDAAGALGAAHAAGIVHRDMKPENVFVTSDGRTKVLDFGLAQRSSEAPLTREGTILGTPAYMAPEQIRGETLDGRADQFSWGVTAFEVLSGKTPWGPITDALALAVRIVGEPTPSLEGAAPEVPPAVVRAVDRALAKSPADRFRSMTDLIDALSPFVEPPPTTTFRLAPSAARGPRSS